MEKTPHTGIVKRLKISLSQLVCVFFLLALCGLFIWAESMHAETHWIPSPQGGSDVVIQQDAWYQMPLKHINKELVVVKAEWQQKQIQLSSLHFLNFTWAFIAFLIFYFIFMLLSVRRQWFDLQLILLAKPLQDPSHLPSKKVPILEEKSENIDADIIEQQESHIKHLQQELAHVQEQLKEQMLISGEHSQHIESHEKNVIALHEEIECLKSDILLMGDKQRQTYEKMSAMIVRAMLQSQSASIGGAAYSVQVYRQLSRVFDWCYQRKVPELMSDENIVLQQDLSAALFRITFEAQLQRNELYLHIEQLLPEIFVDSRLFHRSITSVSRLLLMEQFNAVLTLNVRYERNKKGADIYFDFVVETTQQRKKIPTLVNELISYDSNQSKHAAEAVQYVYILLNALGAIHIKASLLNKGYHLSFCLPTRCENQSPIQISKLPHNILCCFEEKGRHTVSHYLKTSNASPIMANSCDDAIKLLSKDILDKTPIAVVLIASENYDTHFLRIKAHIETLPKAKQPKLMLLQSSVPSLINKQGIFDQAQSPLFPEQFLKNIALLIRSSAPDNCLLPAKILNAHQYESTQAEVLLASSNLQQQQTLIRLLHWLGLQVQVVASAKNMLNHWKTGRYLILLTDFNESPFIELEAGKGVKRGVFTLTSDTYQQLSEAGVTESWVCESLALIERIDVLIKQLSPWLKAKSAVLPETIEVKAEETPQLQAVKPLEKTERSEAFSLRVFSDNQGSPELAAYMLDDYLQDAMSAKIQLEEALLEQNIESVSEALKELLVIAKILGSEELIITIEQLNTRKKQDILKIDKIDLQSLNTSVQNIHDYAEAI